jgi:hypothetical protein
MDGGIKVEGAEAPSAIYRHLAAPPLSQAPPPRTNRKTLTFIHPFFLKAVHRTLPPGDYQVVTDEELIDGLSFPVYAEFRP